MIFRLLKEKCDSNENIIWDKQKVLASKGKALSVQSLDCKTSLKSNLIQAILKPWFGVTKDMLAQLLQLNS